jgi:lysylphosphatidylglycerol synthetase-like protein (DUF2156 family)
LEETSVKQSGDARSGSDTAGFRLNKLRSFGRGSLAYSSLQEGLKYFMHPLGYVAYSQLPESQDSVVVLADPICAADQMKQFLSAFLESKRDPIFLNLSRAAAKILSELGFTVNELGVETIIDIQAFDLVGSKKQQLRNARNGARKDG